MIFNKTWSNTHQPYEFVIQHQRGFTEFKVLMCCFCIPKKSLNLTIMHSFWILVMFHKCLHSFSFDLHGSPLLSYLRPSEMHVDNCGRSRIDIINVYVVFATKYNIILWINISWKRRHTYWNYFFPSIIFFGIKIKYILREIFWGSDTDLVRWEFHQKQLSLWTKISVCTNTYTSWILQCRRLF